MSTFANYELFQIVGARDSTNYYYYYYYKIFINDDHFHQSRVVPDNRCSALNKLVKVATLRWESEEMSPESLGTQ